MTSRRLIILIACALVALLGALLLSRQSPTSRDSEAALLYPKLEAELESITSLSIYEPGDVLAVELTRSDGNWRVSQRSDYPADTAKVHRLLRALAKAKPVEEKTSNPESYPALGVEDVSDANATGSRLQLAGTATPVNLIVGKPGQGAQSAYVRRAGESASWLINESIEAPAEPQDWLRKEILNVSADKVHSATVDIAGKPYTASKASRAAADFAIDKLPKGKKLSSPAAANAFASALTALTLADVRPAKEFEADKPAARATFKTFDGLVLDMDGWTKDDKHYIAVKAAYDEALAKQFHVATATPETPADAASEGAPESSPATPAPPSIDARGDAKAMSARLSGWVYEIPDYKYEAIFKPLDEE